MTEYLVFYRRLPEDLYSEVNRVGWSASPGGIAYLNTSPAGEEFPDYTDAAKFDLFELAASVSASDKNSIFSTMNNRFDVWHTDPNYVCFTTFPRSMSKGDIIYDMETGEWTYVSSYGFDQVTDVDFIEYLKKKIS